MLTDVSTIVGLVATVLTVAGAALELTRPARLRRRLQAHIVVRDALEPGPLRDELTARIRLDTARLLVPRNRREVTAIVLALVIVASAALTLSGLIPQGWAPFEDRTQAAIIGVGFSGTLWIVIGWHWANMDARARHLLDRDDRTRRTARPPSWSRPRHGRMTVSPRTTSKPSSRSPRRAKGEEPRQAR